MWPYPVVGSRSADRVPACTLARVQRVHRCLAHPRLATSLRSSTTTRHLSRNGIFFSFGLRISHCAYRERCCASFSGISPLEFIQKTS